jgi:AcrR family transcriptional regulator
MDVRVGKRRSGGGLILDENLVRLSKQCYYRWRADLSGFVMPAKPAAGTPYGDAYAAGLQAQRQLLLDAASRLLETEGPEALTMRRIASEVGCSTSVLYSMFGSKAGIAEALWCEGFERLYAALSAVDGDDPLARLAAMGQIYRDSALHNQSYYGVMFGRPIPGFVPSEEAYEVSLRPLRLLTDAVETCVEAGVFRRVDPAHAARVLWAASHGVVSLELAGYEGAIDADACYRDLLAAAGAWFLAPAPAAGGRTAKRRKVPSQ